MNLAAVTVRALEGAPLPDPLAEAGIRHLVARTQRKLARAPSEADAAFVRGMAAHAIAEHTVAANAQHYELPAAFFSQVLGPRRKYSCCLYVPGDDLAAAEVRALKETCRHAALAEGQSILELGCGWGALSLWMAERYPRSRVTAVSNSHSQRRHIEGEARRLGLTNLSVVTADMNLFATAERFDRVVSVEMFEHMSNWADLLQRVRGWLKPEGRLFIHVFAHASTPYRFDVADPSDWVAQHFFAGGVMPSHGLIRQFEGLFELEDEWRWDGGHYQRTARDWLANLDRTQTDAMAILTPVYGVDARLWLRRWRLFFLATAGLFGHAGGQVWGVSHYRLKPTA
jgi:cyclopropane-fatty-acyl-phospholipid synthase